jgi:hypothetical protein
VAGLGQVVRISDTFFKVMSESMPHYYYHVDTEQLACSCPGYYYRGECKHLRMVKDFLKSEKKGEVQDA